MQKQQSIILTLGIFIALVCSSKFDLIEGTVNIKLTLHNMSWILIAIILVLIQHLYSRKKIPSPQQSDEKNTQSKEDFDSPMRPRKDSALIQEELDLSQNNSYADMGELYNNKTSQSQKDFDASSISSFRKRSNSIASDGIQRRVSFDESQNTIHKYKKNNKLEIKNYESSLQQQKQDKKKKNELIKQKRKIENFKKLNINDINKKGRKRKSSLDENLSQSSN